MANDFLNTMMQLLIYEHAFQYLFKTMHSLINKEEVIFEIITFRFLYFTFRTTDSIVKSFFALKKEKKQVYILQM